MEIMHNNVQIELDLYPEVHAALCEGRALVAMESSVISHGLPRPHNLESAQKMEAEVRNEGAVPATVAILGGRIKVGLSDVELEALSVSDNAVKATRRDLANIVTRRLTAGTTVSSTMMAAHRAGICVMATGGIGGVHRGNSGDVSADLPELSRTSMVVVCSGPKAILDVAGTMEWLETYGVPVVGYRTDELPAFFSRSSGIRLDVRVDTPEEVVQMVMTQRGLGLNGSLLVVVPVPEEAALSSVAIESMIEDALETAVSEEIRGKALTPFILKRLVSLTGGASLKANLSLLKRNARVAAQISVELAGIRNASRD